MIRVVGDLLLTWISNFGSFKSTGFALALVVDEAVRGVIAIIRKVSLSGEKVYSDLAKDKKCCQRVPFLAPLAEDAVIRY